MGDAIGSEGVQEIAEEGLEYLHWVGPLVLTGYLVLLGLGSIILSGWRSAHKASENEEGERARLSSESTGEPGVVELNVKVPPQKTLYTLWLVILATFAADGIIVIVVAFKDNLWFEDRFDLYIETSIVIWTLAGIALLLPSLFDQKRASRVAKTVFFVLLAFLIEVARLVLTLIAPVIDAIDKGSEAPLGKIPVRVWLHVGVSGLRIVVCLALLQVLLFARVYLPRRSEILGQSSTPNGYGTFANGSTTVSTEPKKPSPTFWQTVNNLKVLLPKLWPSDNRLLQFVVFVCFMLLIAARVVNLFVPKVIGDLTNDLTDRKSPWKNVALWIVLRLLQGQGGVLQVMQNSLWVPVGQYTELAISKTMFDHLHKLSLAYHLRKKTGEVLRILDRGDSINSLFQMAVFSLLPIFFDLGIAIVFFWVTQGAVLALVLLFTMLVYVTTTILLANMRTKWRREMIGLDNEASAIRTDSVLGYESVKYFTAEERESGRYVAAKQKALLSERKVSYSLNALNFAQAAILISGLLVGTVYIAYQITHGFLKVGAFVVFLQYYQQLSGPLNVLGTLYRVIQQQLVDTEKMLDLLKEEPDITDSAQAKAINVERGSVEFRNVHFSYDGKIEALKGISFKVPAGQSVALVGDSGGGKTTVLRLLFRFYDVREGSILVDGQDIRHVTQKSLRNMIGVVPQDTVLFNDTVFYNIAYGREGSTEEEVHAAARAAQIHDRILSFPDGYKTKVGERGLRLSGGEKQRVSLARCILKDPSIVLLDEATSSLDSNTERHIQDALVELSKNRTTLTIAHRLSTIIHSDLIIVVHDGKVAEQGNHDELVGKGGLYAELWSKQVKSEKGSVTAKSSLRAMGGKPAVQSEDGPTKDSGGSRPPSAREGPEEAEGCVTQEKIPNESEAATNVNAGSAPELSKEDAVSAQSTSVADPDVERLASQDAKSPTQDTGTAKSTDQPAVNQNVEAIEQMPFAKIESARRAEIPSAETAETSGASTQSKEHEMSRRDTDRRASVDKLPQPPEKDRSVDKAQPKTPSKLSNDDRPGGPSSSSATPLKAVPEQTDDAIKSKVAFGDQEEDEDFELDQDGVGDKVSGLRPRSNSTSKWPPPKGVSRVTHPQKGTGDGKKKGIWDSAVGMIDSGGRLMRSSSRKISKG